MGPTVVPERCDEGLVGGVVLEQRCWRPGEGHSTSVEAHAEDAVEGARWRRTQWRSRRRWVCDGEMTGLGFRGLGHT
jgi:hypothetical protein